MVEQSCTFLTLAGENLSIGKMHTPAFGVLKMLYQQSSSTSEVALWGVNCNLCKLTPAKF